MTYREGVVSSREQFPATPTTRTVGQQRATLAAAMSTQFLSVLDGHIVSIALPSIAQDVGFSPTGLQWVLNAYMVPLAGVLLLGGRIADVFGRRPAFLGGLALLGTGSLLGGVATTPAMLLAGRVLQGLGAAVSIPAALALVVTTFPEGPQRTRALAKMFIGGGVAMVSAGLLGGTLTALAGWHWVLLINLPVAGLAAALGWAGMAGHHDERSDVAFDVTGAAAGVGALTLLVLATVETRAAGWLTAPTVTAAGAALLLAVVFVVVELRHPAPLLRFGLLRSRPVAGANLLAIVFSSGFIAPLFLGTIYLQDVLGFDPLEAGLAFLPLSLVVVLSNPLLARLTARLGVAPVTAAGFVLVGLAFAHLSAASGGSYALEVLPGFVLAGVGVTAAIIPMAVAAVTGVSDKESGMASGVFNASLQVGGAVMLALIAAVAAGAMTDTASPEALAGGLQNGFRFAAVLNVVAAVAAVLFFRPTRPERSAEVRS
jgi:EmrB/QacA subfamily drug resistance transporter